MPDLSTEAARYRQDALSWPPPPWTAPWPRAKPDAPRAQVAEMEVFLSRRFAAVAREQQLELGWDDDGQAASPLP